MNIRIARRVVANFRHSSAVTEVEYLRKGYSTDRKYLLWVGDRPSYLLRLSSISEALQKRDEFDLVADLHLKGIACPEPVEFGLSEADGVCFGVFGYIEGECAESVLPRLTTDEQYAVGLQAGRELRLMHRALVVPASIDWVRIRTDKHFSNKAYVREHGLVFDQQQAIEHVVENSLSLLDGRPLTFLHGDYHPGNMILHSGRYVGAIDFNRCRWGDPYFEFYKVSQFSAPLSPAFANGQIQGYFEGEPPGDFWPMYNLYIAMVLNADLVWTHQHYPKAIARSSKLIGSILSTHDLFGDGMPIWYMPA